MPTLVSNPANFGSIRNAFTTEGLGSSTSFFAYRQGGGIVPATSQYDVVGAGTAGDPLRMSQFNGLSVGAAATPTWNPDGGPSGSERVILNSEGGGGADAEVQIDCSQTAVWTWTRSGSTTGYATVSSGGSATSITFVLPNPTTSPRFCSFSVTSTAGGISKYYTVTLSNTGFA